MRKSKGITANLWYCLSKGDGFGRVMEQRRIHILWWSQLVTSPFWAQELSFEHLVEIASIYAGRQQASFLQNVSLDSASSSLPCSPN